MKMKYTNGLTPEETKLAIYEMLARVHNYKLIGKIYVFIQTWIEMLEKDGEPL